MKANKDERIVEVLAKNPDGMTTGSLAQRLGFSRSGMERALGRLRKVGLLTRFDSPGMDDQSKYRWTVAGGKP